MGVCVKMLGIFPIIYSHLIGIMISKTIGVRGLHYFQTHPWKKPWNWGILLGFAGDFTIKLRDLWGWYIVFFRKNRNFKWLMMMDRWIWGFEISDMVVADGSKMEMLAHANGGFDRCDFNIRNSDSQVDWTDLGLDNFHIMVFGWLKFKMTRETGEMMIDQLDFGVWSFANRRGGFSSVYSHTAMGPRNDCAYPADRPTWLGMWCLLETEDFPA